MEGEEGRGVGRGFVANHGFESTTSGTTTNGGTNIVVVGHGAAFAVEVLSVEGHLAIGTGGNGGIQHHVIVEHEFVDGIVAFRNFGEGQRVVVVQGRVVSRGGPFHKREGRGLLASEFPNVRSDGLVQLDHERPHVGCAVAFGDGNKLTLDDTGLGAIGAHDQINVVVVSHLERQFLTFNSEQAIARGEVEDGHRVDRTFAKHREVERFHPSIDRTDTKVQAVDDFVFTFHVSHMELVANFATATSRGVGNGGLGKEVALDTRGNLSQT